MNKERIISEIQRTAKINGGRPLGANRFATETGIKRHDWYGRFWSRWSDAVREAGFEPNRLSEAYSDAYMLEKLVLLTRCLRLVPVEADVMLAGKNDPTFPSKAAFWRLGSKSERASRIIAFCEAHSGYDDVAALWRPIAVAEQPKEAEDEDDNFSTNEVGYVYLLKHGSRREYKIGHTNNPLRREGEMGIQLPEKLQPIHYIETDDPAGVESYWHRRFQSKCKEGEWFGLTPEDIRAFKRWKRIY